MTTRAQSGTGQGLLARVKRWLRPPRRLSFTRDGRILVFLAVGVGFAAINTGNNLLYLLLGWQLSFIVASGVMSEMTLRNLRVERRAPPRIYVNEPFLMEVVVTNAKSKNASYSIEVEDLIAGVPIDKRCYFLKIPNGKSQQASYRHTFTRRGLYTLSDYRLATKFPFALFRKSRDIEAPLTLLVYPARVEVQRPTPRSVDRGDTISERLGRRGEFFGLREHRRGDDRRDVHWKSSARLGRLLIREYEDELARRVVISVDNALPLEVFEAAGAGAGATPSEVSIHLRTPLAGVLRTPVTLGNPRRGAEPGLSHLRTPLAGGLRTPVTLGNPRRPLEVPEGGRGAEPGLSIGPWTPGFNPIAPSPAHSANNPTPASPGTAHGVHLAAVERAISIAASLAAAYLEAGWAVELAARGCHVPSGTGRFHEAKIAKALALLPYVSDEVAFPILQPRIERVLVQPRGTTLRGRPRAHTVIDA